MKQFDLKEYAPIMVVEEYTIFEHPKTFHHVMVCSGRRKNTWEREQVAQWNMPGLATDGSVVVPPGFMRAVIKKLGTAGKKVKSQVEEAGFVVGPVIEPDQPQNRNLNWEPPDWAPPGWVQAMPRVWVNNLPPGVPPPAQPAEGMQAANSLADRLLDELANNPIMIDGDLVNRFMPVDNVEF